MANNNGTLANRALLGQFSANRNKAQLGASLVEAGLSQMGNPGAGKAIGEYLRQEWWRKEAETFNATVGKDIQTKLNSGMEMYKKRTKLTTEIGAEDQDPAELRKGYYSEFDEMGSPLPDSFIPMDDPMAVNTHLNTAAQEMIGGIQGVSMEYMDAAGQFPNNPLIANAAQNMMNHITGSFDSQLAAIKMADAQAGQRNKALDIEKKQRQAEIDEAVLPDTIKAEQAKAEASVFDLDQAKLTAKAEAARGQEISILEGRDVDAMDDDDFIIEYRKHIMKVKDESAKAEAARKSGRNIVPAGVDINNVGDWLKYDAKGQGVLDSFWQDENRKALEDPAVKAKLDAAAQDLRAKNFKELRAIAPERAKDIMKNVMQEADVWDYTQQNAVKRATEYLIETGNLKPAFGLDPKAGVQLPLSEEGAVSIKLFESSDELIRTVKPELYQEEVTEAINPPVTDEDAWNSGDPEDPFGDANVPDDSPISPVREQREIKAMENYTDWLNTFAEDDTMTASQKVSHAKRALKDINSALEGLRTRQATVGQGLPQEEYDSRLTDLLDLKANFQAITKGPKVFILNPESKDAIANVVAMTRRGIDLLMQDTAEGLAHLEGDDTPDLPLGGPKPTGIFTTHEKARRKGTLTGPIIESGVPYWMATPEEKQKRMQAFNERMQQFGR